MGIRRPFPAPEGRRLVARWREPLERERTPVPQAPEGRKALLHALRSTQKPFAPPGLEVAGVRFQGLAPPGYQPSPLRGWKPTWACCILGKSHTHHRNPGYVAPRTREPGVAN